MGARGRIRSVGALVVVAGLLVACETPHDLGTFGGEQSNALAINEAGVIAGWANPRDRFWLRAVRWVPDPDDASAPARVVTD